MKTVSCKIEDSLYDKISEEQNNISEFLRTIILKHYKDRENNNEKQSIP